MSVDFLRNYQLFSFKELKEKTQSEINLPILESKPTLENEISPVGITNALQGIEFLFKDNNIDSAYSLTHRKPIYRHYTNQESTVFINKKHITKFLLVIGEAHNNNDLHTFSQISANIEKILCDHSFTKKLISDDFIGETKPCYHVCDFNRDDNLNLNSIVKIIKDSNDVNYSRESYYLSNQAIDILIYIGNACQHGWHLTRNNSQVLGLDSLRSFVLNSLTTIPCIIDFSENRFCMNTTSHEILTPRKLIPPVGDIHMQNIYGKAFSFIEKYNGIPFSSYYVGNICIIPDQVTIKIYDTFLKKLLKTSGYPSIKIISEVIQQTKIHLKDSIQKLQSFSDNITTNKLVFWNTIFGVSHGNIKYVFSSNEATKKKKGDDIEIGRTKVKDILEYVEKSAPNQEIKPTIRVTDVVRSYLLCLKSPPIERTIFIHLLTAVSQNHKKFSENIQVIKSHLNELRSKHPKVADFRLIVPNKNSIIRDLNDIFAEEEGVTIQTFNKVLLMHSKDFHLLNETETPKMNVEPIIEKTTRDFDLSILKDKYDEAKQKFVIDFIEESQKHILVIVGEASFGKTHFLTQVCQSEIARLALKNGQVGTLLFIKPDDCFAFSGILDEKKALLSFIHYKLSKYSMSEKDVEVLLREGSIIPVFDGLDEICTQCKLDAETIIRNFKGIMGGEEDGKIYKVIFSSRTAYWNTFFPKHVADDDTIVYKIKGFSDKQVNDYISKRVSLIEEQSLSVEEAKSKIGIIKHLSTHGELSPLILEIIFDAYRDGAFEFLQYNEEKGDLIDDKWLYLINNICSRENIKMGSPMLVSEHLAYLVDIATSFDVFSSNQITKAFNKFIDVHNVSINSAVLISHPLFKIMHGSDQFEFRHPVIKNYLRFYGVKDKIEDQLIAPGSFFIDAYSSDNFFKDLVNTELFNNKQFKEKDFFEIIRLLISRNPSHQPNTEITNMEPLLGFHLMESYFKFRSLTMHERSLKLFKYIFQTKTDIIQDIHFTYTASRIDFSGKKFENCVFSDQFSFDHCQMGDVSFRNCYFESDFHLIACGKKDRIRIKQFESLDKRFEAVMKSKYNILFIKQKNIEDTKMYLEQVLNKFIGSNGALGEINQIDLRYDNQDYITIVRELYNNKDQSKGILHPTTKTKVKIKSKYRQEVMNFLSQGLVSNKINTLINNIIMKLR